MFIYIHSFGGRSGPFAACQRRVRLAVGPREKITIVFLQDSREKQQPVESVR